MGVFVASVFSCMKATWRAVGMKQISENSFQPDWLALREPADHAARDAMLLARAAACAKPDLHILDLGSGTGSTARAFAEHGFNDFSWRFFDNDPALLEVAKTRHPTSDCVQGSLADLDTLPLEKAGLVTASALLDLMPARWIEALARRLHASSIPFYAALSYDGDMRWNPKHAADAAITEAFNTHQCRDKGLGAALGPMAGKETTRIFAAHGFEVMHADSPWKIGPDQAALHDELLIGIGKAGVETGESQAEEWTIARRAMVSQSHAVIGHTDILAIPKLRS
jgi:SAM-dependent methyltransferase